MLRKFLPLFVLGVLGIILMIAFVVRAPFKEDEVPGFSEGPGEPVVEGEQKEASFQESVRKKLNEIRIPEMELNNATIEETVEFLRLRSIELSEEENPSNRGFGFIVRGARVVDELDGDLKDGFGDAADPNATLISLSVKDIGIADALDLICAEAGLQWIVDEEAVKILMTPIEKEISFQELVKNKLKEIRIPIFELKDATIDEASDKLAIVTFEWDLNSGMSRGMSYVLRSPGLNLESQKEESEQKELEAAYTKEVTLSVKDHTVYELLDLLCEKYGLEWVIGDYAVTIGPIGMAEEKLVPREVDPNDPFADPEDDPFAPDE